MPSTTSKKMDRFTSYASICPWRCGSTPTKRIRSKSHWPADSCNKYPKAYRSCTIKGLSIAIYLSIRYKSELKAAKSRWFWAPSTSQLSWRRERLSQSELARRVDWRLRSNLARPVTWQWTSGRLGKSVISYCADRPETLHCKLKTSLC